MLVENKKKKLSTLSQILQKDKSVNEKVKEFRQKTEKSRKTFYNWKKKIEDLPKVEGKIVFENDVEYFFFSEQRNAIGFGKYNLAGIDEAKEEIRKWLNIEVM